MTTKRNSKCEQYKLLKFFFETKWSKHSVTTHNQARKEFASTKKELRLPISEMELRGNSKKQTDFF